MQNLFCGRSLSLCSRSCLSLCGLLRRSVALFVLLVNNGLNDTCKSCNRRIECGADSRHKNIVGREICKLVNGVKVDDLAVQVTGLNLETLVIFGEFLCDAGCSCVVLRRSGKCGGTGENVFQLSKTCLICCTAKKCILNDGVVDACLTELFAELGVISNAYTAVLNENACNGVVELIGDIGDSLFFLFKNLFARQMISPPKRIMPFLFPQEGHEKPHNGNVWKFKRSLGR